VLVGACSYAPEPTGVPGDGPAPGEDVATVADASVDTPIAPPEPFHLYVEAKIDGRSNLIIRGTSVAN
jgi:hypothetical protein